MTTGGPVTANEARRLVDDHQRFADGPYCQKPSCELTHWPCPDRRQAETILELYEQLARSRAKVERVRAVWDEYADADMGEVPWRLQREMKAALDGGAA